MTKYQELGRLHADSVQEQREYADVCREFCQTVLAQFIAYFECPPEAVKVFPPEGADKGTVYTLWGAMQLEEDAAWHVKFSLELPKLIVTFNLHVRFCEEVFYVRIQLLKDDVFEFRRAEEYDFSKVFNKMFARMEDHFQNGFQKWIRKEGEVKTIGFPKPTKPVDNEQE
ncbi:MAG: hypothetical protein K8T25_20465 [Planctomycetia bacterium]|nr:hypothetical protein [Planctomycetia bacterium]